MADVNKIKKYLRTSIFGKYIYFFPEIDSTNSYAHRLAHEGAPEGTIVITDYQSNGRGRHERVWESSPGANILISLILRPRLSVERFIRITLASAEIVISALDKFLKRQKQPRIHFKVKWPNDILVSGKKIAGILTESNIREKEIIYAIVGIGLNVNQKISELSEETRSGVTSLLNETDVIFERERLIADIINEFESRYFILERTNYDQVIESWKKRCDLIGKDIMIETHSDVEAGRFLDVNERGILIYKTKDGQVKELITGTIKRMSPVYGSDD
jgi:BirA family biotin operon repressor/biotin-[acetyl-CoA-carboxylase] ligase